MADRKNPIIVAHVENDQIQPKNNNLSLPRLVLNPCYSLYVKLFIEVIFFPNVWEFLYII